MKLKIDRKNYVIIALFAIVLVMAVGYAAFSSLLTINGTASLTSSFCVGFDNTKLNTYTVTTGMSGGTAPTGSMSYSGTACSTKYVPNSTLSSTFHQPGDKIEYTLTIANKSTFTVGIASIQVENQSVTSNTTITKGNVKYIVEMPLSTTLASNAETTMKVTAMFQNDTDVTGNYTGETQTLNVKINAEQGNNGFTPTSAEQTVYAINTDSIYKNTSTLQDIGTPYNSCSATGKNVCLKYTVENNTVTGAEVCFIKGGTEHCLQGWVDECLAPNGSWADCTFTGTKTVFNSNVGVLNTAFTEYDVCTDGDEWYYCLVSGVYANVEIDGYVYASNDDDHWDCEIGYVDGARCDTGIS